MTLRVVLADDSYLVREALCRALQGDEGIEVVAVCAGRDALLAAIEAERPDVVLTDIRMPPDYDAEGVRVAADLRETHPDVGVVVLSQYLEPRSVLELLANNPAIAESLGLSASAPSRSTSTRSSRSWSCPSRRTSAAGSRRR